jgi:hypothetical protein
MQVHKPGQAAQCIDQEVSPATAVRCAPAVQHFHVSSLQLLHFRCVTGENRSTALLGRVQRLSGPSGCQLNRGLGRSAVQHPSSLVVVARQPQLLELRTVQ